MKNGLDWKIVGYGLDWMCYGLDWMCIGMDWMCIGMDWMCIGMDWMCIGMDWMKIPLDCSVRSSRSKTQVYLGKLVKMVLYTLYPAVFCGSC